ncbi:hypothetical protein AAVH_02391 [Aphelenchoides avenae]|nr:hypothetical protein AAVH_02391 [Aphelenchus avenae]
MSSDNKVGDASAAKGQNGHVINVTDDVDSLSEGQTDEDSDSDQERDERVPCTDAVESPFLDDLIVRLMTAKVETDQTAKPKR